MTFPVMNLNTSIKDSKFDKFDTIKGIIRKAKNLEQAIGSTILMSDGKLKVGYNPDLITKRGCFNISNDDTERFYWDDGNNFFNSEPYFIKNSKVFIGSQMADPISFKIKGHISFANLYNKPLLTIKGLYKQNKIKNIVGFLKPKENIAGKIEFLEKLLIKTDKSGYQPKEMIIKDNQLRLKLLENHYKNNIDYYAMKF